VRVLAGAAALMLLGVSLLSSYFAHRLVQVRPVEERYALRVVALAATGTVTLTRGPDADEPGSFRLSWPAGHATVGPVVTSDGSTVTRSLTQVSGRLRPGQRVGIQSNPFTGDPASALGLSFADVAVAGPTGALPAWYVAGQRRTWVLLIHGLDGSRSDALPAMTSLHDLGFPMLAITYRNDVGAARSADHRSHLGDTEWQDVEAAIGYAQANGAEGVVLYGWSLGAGMAVVVSERSPLRDTVRALVLDSPLLDWRATLSFNASRHRLPAPVTWASETMLAVSLGVHLDQYRQTRLSAALSTRTLVVQGTADTVVPLAPTDAFARARPDLVSYLRVPGADHVSVADSDPGGYAAGLRRVLGSLP
jgi:pimeloyl-ACP methyl ester carboxylesterase